MANILIVDDEENIRIALRTILKKQGHKIIEAENGKVALRYLKTDHKDIHIMLLDLHMPEMGGLQLLEKVRTAFPDLLTVVITAYSTAENTMKAMSLGAYDYIVKPFDIAQVKTIVANAVEMSTLSEKAKQLPQPDQKQSSERIIGKSAAMQEVYKLVGKVSATTVPVLLQGESGTGKERIARAIHFNSTRSDQPLVNVNCGAIPENLLESELFGFEKGAFSGATATKPGKFEVAHNGTLFLDEIGELSLGLQVKLLRALQEQEIERLGSTTPIKINVRVITATNRNLKDMVEYGQFRSDLYYRLNVVPIQIPALRERKEDIPELVHHLLESYATDFGYEKSYITPESLELLHKYHWPGNIRQLQNVLRRALIFSTGGVILPKHLTRSITDSLPKSKEESTFVLQQEFKEGDTIKSILQETEKAAMKWALAQTNGNKTHASELLQMSRKSFINKCKDYQLD
ncbi:sigma-54-dependent transcriptional regulator [Anaerobacillus sp. MEB173]|uniref:sigma-54-dependent transcriptional regulator n=1 Tax=Anaerobacillus sp. MEB173 TaxID=3383345 RepID=UPI003F92A375